MVPICFLFIIHAYNQLRRVMKRQPPALAFLFVLQSVLIFSVFFFLLLIVWTASSEFGTYRLCEQRRFRRACASAQSRQNIRCSLIQAVNQEEPSNRKPRSLAPLNGWTCAVEICHDGMLEDTNSLDGAHVMINNLLTLLQ